MPRKKLRKVLGRRTALQRAERSRRTGVRRELRAVREKLGCREVVNALVWKEVDDKLVSGWKAGELQVRRKMWKRSRCVLSHRERHKPACGRENVPARYTAPSSEQARRDKMRIKAFVDRKREKSGGIGVGVVVEGEENVGRAPQPNG